ncbi:MAG: hypothetical protein ABJB03_06690, partial [Rhodoglobus sp.]
QQLLDDAEARSKATIEEAEKHAAQLVSEAEERLAKIRIERESVAGYLENLRGVLQQAEKVASEI